MLLLIPIREGCDVPAKRALEIFYLLHPPDTGPFRSDILRTLVVTCSYRAVTQRSFRNTPRCFHATKVRIAKAASRKETCGLNKKAKNFRTKPEEMEWHERVGA